MNYLVCYDIADPRRLRKTAKTLEKSGIRVQYSFFELDVSADRLETLLGDLKKVIKPSEDKLFVYPICAECKKRAVIDGTGALLRLETFRIL
ncbi:MAG TPA: CRISPR-associated endonuclease Cas2 [Spirochaetota bacterium]|nr:CRISPR-associated endonuclease Cas2 [Spirochaetota bacterium]